MAASRPLLLLAGAAALLLLAGSLSFAAPPAVRGPALRASTATGVGAEGQAAGGVSGTSTAFFGAAACGLAAAALMGSRRSSKTAAKYTTQKILPSFAWIKTGIKPSDLEPTQLVAQTLIGNDVLIGKDESGKLFCVANLCPHIGTPMSEGADVIGDVIVCPLHGSSFSTKTGDLIDWCPSPPIIGPLTGLVVERKNLLVLECRVPIFGDEIEVQVDVNAKKAYEADYWKGLLDAQGKDDGTYY